MKKFYISFGQIHVHSLNGVTLDKDCLLEVKAKDLAEARQKVFDSIGNKWHTSYTEAEAMKSLSFFPRGIIKAGL